MLRSSVGDVDWVERVKHCTSGSLVISDLGVREMWFALLDMNIATRGRRWDYYYYISFYACSL